MRPQELNLMVIFDTIMTEKSITRAADRLSMTQPAVSNAVARMRDAWKEELFVKDGRNIQPTIYAKNLWEQIKDPLHELNQAVNPGHFDPKTAKRTFRVAVSDIVVDTIWLEMRRLFEEQAPGINLHAVPYTIVNTQQVLDDAEVDLVVAAKNPMQENIRSSHLFDSCLVCCMRKDHPLAKPDLSIEEFAAADHLLVSLSGNTDSPTDQALQQYGLKRRVAFTVNHFASAAPILIGSDLIAMLPTGLNYNYIDNGELSVTKAPLEIPRHAISMLWHKRQDKDAGLQWLRMHMHNKMVANWQHNMQKVQDCLCS
ncbi:LysR family transcriptional regulator [Dasania sp. GY-MA-18]|uniref:LysR family transcriptional regulator n=1 Tax=Dasania phycosphaerae TaxID=2950436 RepID=A0A9J6RGF1_9GAMM|nr:MULTISPECIES: LysR family transcriptional regulator [Dasania]MCR8921298.1 LysR family transcriptional regulator [Dasania sp. GY-MA-18]MCZ0863726.1 LysR family transcriptional regulator [Dasania phycosphaerae]MCZ0867454.1 LysR family transcriptional regulator [Dasania phycosphaerae]